MGIHGWKLLSNSTKTLEGVVDRVDYSGGFPKGDGDWLLWVKPDDPNDPLLTNGNGFTNQDGLIECEVEPSVDQAGDFDSDSDQMHQYFDDLVDKRVRVRGAWVSDCSHTWDGNDCEFEACCDEGKTEIHPIFSIETELSEPDSTPKRVDLLVFSDASSQIKPPNAGTSVTGFFNLRFPPVGANENPFFPEFEILSEKADMAAEVDYQLIPAVQGPPPIASGPRLEVTVESGTPGEGKGFYHATVQLKFQRQLVK